LSSRALLHFPHLKTTSKSSHPHRLIVSPFFTLREKTWRDLEGHVIRSQEAFRVAGGSGSQAIQSGNESAPCIAAVPACASIGTAVFQSQSMIIVDISSPHSFACVFPGTYDEEEKGGGRAAAAAPATTQHSRTEVGNHGSRLGCCGCFPILAS